MGQSGLPDNLLAGWRALEGINGVEVPDGFAWHEAISRWALHCQLAPDVLPEGPIPAITEWYVLISPDYPSGRIKFYPAKAKSIVHTFPHQSYNGEGSPDLPWRTGDLCLDTTVRVLGRHGYDTELHDADSRLKWHFLRAMKWLEAASRGELLAPGDPFELPQFPPASLTTTVFAEGGETFRLWQGIPNRCGGLELRPLSDDPGILVVTRFHPVVGKPLLTPKWGRVLTSEDGKSQKGVWIRLDELPVFEPWQAPTTFEELAELCTLQGIDLYELLKPTAFLLRDGRRHLALVGFPIPVKVGGPPQQMHWQAMMLPALSRGTKTANGFRPDEPGYWRKDRQEILRPITRVDWLSSENWHRDEILTRGRLPDELASKRILLLGAGAIGSAVAELLVRAGVQRVIVMDGDSLHAGNLARHTLGLQDIGENKATHLAARLNTLSPHASAEGIDRGLPPSEDSEAERVRKCEVVIDCTGDDNVIRQLEAFRWEHARFFASVSLGFAAKRLFIFTAYAEEFPSAGFKAGWEPWLRMERKDCEGQEFPWEGVGCWHPVFPARADDVWMMSSIAVKRLAAEVASSSVEESFRVYEQLSRDGVFAGVVEASLESESE